VVDSGNTPRQLWLTLVAMTLAGSMILVDQTAVPMAIAEIMDDLNGPLSLGQWVLTANILPLAAFLVLGGRLGDGFGLKRSFLAGAVVFALATTAAGLSLSLPWLLTARVVQGLAAAVMMPASVAITSAVWPLERRGFALGLLAGLSAFFAAIGPVLGGLLTAVSWRLVFLINVPLAVAAIVLTVLGTPPLPAHPAARRGISYLSCACFSAFMVLLVFGLAQGQPVGWTSLQVVGSLVASVIFLVAFIWVNSRARVPLIKFSLFRRANFLASVVSQVLAGMVELGLGFLLPYYLLLVVGVDPITAGLALIPGTIPIILAGPLAGRLFDRIGGRWPLTIGFLVLAASGLALAVGVNGHSAFAIIPGLVLQGIALGVVLTVNDPVGMNAVDEDDQGEAAGIINTAEQLGGALGIAILGAVQLTTYYTFLNAKLSDKGVVPTPADVTAAQQFISEALERGIRNVPPPTPRIASVYQDFVDAHGQSFRVAFVASAVIALLGAVASWLLVRKVPGPLRPPVFTRRSRWFLASAGATTPGLTRLPPSAVKPEQTNSKHQGGLLGRESPPKTE
jgi:EmrB/QacA subfamily drug resistance transporter